MREIILTKGQITIVDNIDYAFASSFNWCAVKGRKANTFYAQRRAIVDGKSYRPSTAKNKVYVNANNGDLFQWGRDDH